MFLGECRPMLFAWLDADMSRRVSDRGHTSFRQVILESCYMFSFIFHGRNLLLHLLEFIRIQIYIYKRNVQGFARGAGNL